MNESEQPETGGRFARNLVHFARALRAAGLPVGPGRVLEALKAIEVVGPGRRDDFYWTLHSVFVSRRDQRELFDQCFHIFWRDPKILERMMQLLLPQIEVPRERKRGEEAKRRVAEAFAPETLPGTGEAPGAGKPPTIELDAHLTWSAREMLQHKDFEQMSAAELEEARREIQRMQLTMMAVPTRRFEPHARGRRIDLRRTLRQSLRGGGAAIEIVRKKRQRRSPPIVILCDISGSMSRYSRMLLLFMHTLTNDRDRVYSYVFGTRLTNVTRYLRQRDPDRALEQIGQVVADWGGGTRIASCLSAFNRFWSRRVLSQGAIVLLITDGLDRDAGAGLEGEMERMHKSCRRLVWLNPLLRYDRYAPISSGARIIIRHVDDVRSVHNLKSLRELADALARKGPRRAEGLSSWVRALDLEPAP